MFICDDCLLETDEADVGQAYLNLPDPVCQFCGNDLFDGDYGPKNFAELLKSKSQEERLLEDIFGKRDPRYMRTGSSHRNIEYVKLKVKQLLGQRYNIIKK